MAKGNKKVKRTRLQDSEGTELVPKYETQKDKDAEKEIAEIFGNKTNMIMEEIPGEFSKFDYVALQNGEVRYFLEFKNRSVPFGTYRDVMVDADKWVELINYSKIASAALVVRWSCGTVQVCRYKDHLSTSVRFSGRRLRDGKAERGKPCVHIPINEFTTIHEGTTEPESPAAA